jgi:hypothetical protein
MQPAPSPEMGGVFECPAHKMEVFFTQADLNAHIAAYHKQRPKTVAASSTPLGDQSRPQVPPKPIRLTYKFEGECPQCRSGVETLFLNLAKPMVVAWCPACKKQLELKKVTKL